MKDYRLVVEDVSVRFHTSPAAIMGDSRINNITEARHVVWYLLKKQGLSYKGIAILFNRNHSTILHGVKNVEFYIKHRPRYKEMIDEIINAKPAIDHELRCPNCGHTGFWRVSWGRGNRDNSKSQSGSENSSDRHI